MLSSARSGRKASLHMPLLSSPHAVALARLTIACSRLRGLAARLPSICHCSPHLTQSLLHTTSTLCTAFAPSSPFLQLAVNGAWLKVAFLHGLQRQAFGTSIRMSHYISGQLLLAIWFIHPLTVL